MFTKLKRRINIKYVMVFYVGSLLLIASLYLHEPLRLLYGVAMVCSYSLFDLLWTRIRDGTWYLPVSSWISGFILSIVAAFNTPLPLILILVLPFLSVFAKQLIHLNKDRHIFNPAGFSLLVVNFFTPVITWWAISWGMIPLVIVLCMGIFIVWRLERWHIVIPFFISYSLFFFVSSALGGIDFSTTAKTLAIILMGGPIIFFATVMLIEPITSNFSTRMQRAIYGCLCGFFAIGVQTIILLSKINVDPLIAGLILGNLTASLFFLPRHIPSGEKSVANV